jgi:REP element-mobilizing transposase RayT
MECIDIRSRMRPAEVGPPGLHLVTKLVRAGSPKIFRRDEARYLFRSVVILNKARYGFRLYGYCLLPDRAVLLLRPRPGTDINEVMKGIWGGFSRRVNRRWSRHGAVMRSKFLNHAISDGAQAHQCLAWLHGLPVQHRMTETASGCPVTSSAAYRKGLGDLVVDLYRDPVAQVVEYQEAA